MGMNARRHLTLFSSPLLAALRNCISLWEDQVRDCQSIFGGEHRKARLLRTYR